MPRITKTPVPEADKEAVLTLVNAYAKSLIEPDLVAMKACFYDQATIFSSFGGAVIGGPITRLYENMEQNGGIKGLEFDVKLLSLTAATAVAQVQLFRESPAYELTDFLSLIKLPDGRWTIVSKIFQVYQYSQARTI